MSKQTEAQRLAENLPALFDNDLLDAVDVSGAAAELLRQEALIAELAAAARLVIAWFDACCDPSKTDFYQRMQMCRDSEDALRAALAKVQQ